LAFTGAANENPALAGPERWKNVGFTEVERRGTRDGQETILLMVKGVATRALKLEIEQARKKDSQIVSVSEWSVWTDLKDLPTPAPAPREEPSPVAIEYEVPSDCEMAMVVDDEQGRRVR